MDPDLFLLSLVGLSLVCHLPGSRAKEYFLSQATVTGKIIPEICSFITNNIIKLDDIHNLSSDGAKSLNGTAEYLSIKLKRH